MNKCHKCLLCLGSNCDGIYHLKQAEKAMNRLFSSIRWGSIVRTEPWGISAAESFYNRAAALDTMLEIEELHRLLKQIERDNGRTEQAKMAGIITLDIDLLVYDDENLKPADLAKPYVREALAAL